MYHFFLSAQCYSDAPFQSVIIL